MRYHDFRFQNDKLFCFYKNDFCRRKLANSNCSFFVQCICGQVPPSLDDLKDRMEIGDFSFPNKLQYFSGSLKGTDSYWRRKRDELNAWINYHLEQKHGPPTLFITLSCAEYWWPDLQKLLAMRLRKILDTRHHELSKNVERGDVKSRMKAVNLHTGLVQEFFTLRTTSWIQTFGKKLFKISHYWEAFEFSKGRGQIHTHLLAITNDQYGRLKSYYNLRHSLDCYNKIVQLMADYAYDVLDMTSEHPGLELPTDATYDHSDSMNKHYSDIDNDLLDQRDLSIYCQIHSCNSFCMRHKINCKQ